MNTPNSIETPGLLRRLAAILYDCFLVLPLIMVSVAAALAAGQTLGSAPPDSLAPAWLVQIIVLLCSAGFFILFWKKNGQTLGMQAWRIKLIAMPGKELTLGRALLRYAAAILSAVCLGLGYLWCVVDPEKRSWHDHLSGTQLVLLPKKKK